MGRKSLVQDLGDWLIDQALDAPDIVQLFDQVCNRLRTIGVPVGRARLASSTLHPLYESETVLWRLGHEIEFEQFKHQSERSDEWLRSPMHFMMRNGIAQFRRNLDGPNKLLDYAILDDLVELGLTDYLIIATGFAGERRLQVDSRQGILVAWASDRKGGFSNSDIETLSRIQRRLATAIKSAVQDRITNNIAETYLGRQAGVQVLDGAIKLGDGHDTQAVVWYADMRSSTALADKLPASEFLELLNVYFDCSAGPAIEFGGEVLEFIGDAVLAIFPYEDEAGKKQAVRCATLALEKSLEMTDETNAMRRREGKAEFKFGVGINTGRLMFGNIGVASRLSFSAIGPTINEAERIESLTKELPVRALVTSDIAEISQDWWKSMGSHPLSGVAGTHELFALKADETED